MKRLTLLCWPSGRRDLVLGSLELEPAGLVRRELLTWVSAAVAEGFWQAQEEQLEVLREPSLELNLFLI